MQVEASPCGSPTLTPAKSVVTPCYLSSTTRNSYVQHWLSVGALSWLWVAARVPAQHHGQDLFPVPGWGCSRHRPGQDVAQGNKAVPALMEA